MSELGDTISGGIWVQGCKGQRARAPSGLCVVMHILAGAKADHN